MASDDRFTLAGEAHLLHDFSAMDAAGHINVVVEIPTGTNAKWEVEKSSGLLKWEFKHGKPRVVAYLSYPGNYGMVPRTLLSKQAGGDGDPLDVLVIGPAMTRGSVVQATPIGVLKLLDGGEQDDKIIAVMVDSPLGQVSSLEELQSRFNGITDIIEIWFSNYKGPGELVANGYGDADAANAVIAKAISAYDRAQAEK